MAQHDRLYQRAVYYDVALARDVAKEAEFIIEAFGLYGGRPLESVLELACGPGYHSRALAMKGLRVVGADLSPEMLALAAELAKKEQRSIDWRLADMRDFSLNQPVDMAICMMDGVDALLSTEDAVQHLRCVAASLVEDGLYLIDCTHPRDCSYRDYGTYRYCGERDGMRVELVWSTNAPAIDPVTGIADVEVELRVRRNGGQEVVKDIARERCFTAPELSLLARLSGVFRVVAWHGDADINQPLDATAKSRRMVALLQRTP